MINGVKGGREVEEEEDEYGARVHSKEIYVDFEEGCFSTVV